MPRSRRAANQELPPQCKRFMKRTWNRICSGLYPEDMQYKYGKIMLNEGDPYTVFSAEKKPSIFLLILGSHPVADCKTVEIFNTTAIKCFQGIGQPKVLGYPKSRMNCINYSFGMADELVTYCTSAQLPTNEFTAVFYTDYNERPNEYMQSYSSRCPILSVNILLLVLMALISLYFIFRPR